MITDSPGHRARYKINEYWSDFSLELQEILQQLLSFLRQDRLGVELDAVDGICFVTQAHDFAFFGPGGDVETVGQGLTFYDEGMVACRFERIRQAMKHARAFVMDR